MPPLSLEDFVSKISPEDLARMVEESRPRMESMNRADLQAALERWAGTDPVRQRLAAAMNMVLVDYEVMLPRVKDRQRYRRWVADSVGGLGDQLMTAWDDRHGASAPDDPR